MFYTKQSNNLFYTKSENDVFYFGPFENLWVKGNFYGKTFPIDNFIKQFNLQTWNSWIGNWKNKFFVYKNNEIIYPENLKTNTNNFILTAQIRPSNFLDKNLEFIKKYFKTDTISLSNKIDLIKIYSDKEFIENNLPVFNGLLDKYGFYKFSTIQYCKLTNILDFKTEDNYKEKIENLFKEAKKYKKWGFLFTKSKKEEFRQKIDEIIFEIVKLIVIAYRLIEETLQNKKELEKIINTSLEEYKAQAKLLQNVSFDKTLQLKVKLEELLAMLDFYIDYLQKCFG